MSQNVVGWDIGGAHVKAAVIDDKGVVVSVYQTPCPLWQGMDKLKQAVDAVMADIVVSHAVHVITMTGELVDLFADRDQGVQKIITAMQSYLSGFECYIYAGHDGFLSPGNINQQHYKLIASANWLASASWAATKTANGLFVDIGSTTTDILVLSEKKVQAIGLTDYQRMISDELIYTGIVRTAVMAVAQTVSFQGHDMGLMAEYFATMADVYRLTGELNEAHDQMDTTDGGEKTVLGSAKRLSRMTGYDYAEGDLSLWKQLAKHIKNQQKNKIQHACLRQLSRQVVEDNSYFVGAGIGRFLVKQIADDLGYSYIDYSSLVAHQNCDSEMDVSDCAPAVSVALLMSAR